MSEIGLCPRDSSRKSSCLADGQGHLIITDLTSQLCIIIVDA